MATKFNSATNKYAKAGDYVKAKQAYTASGGTWSKDISRELRMTHQGATYNGWKPPGASDDAGGGSGGGVDNTSEIDKVIDQLRKDREAAQLAADQQAQSLYDTQMQNQRDAAARTAQEKQDRINYWKRPGMESTLLTGTSTDWLKKLREKKSWLTPFSSMLGGNSE